MRNLGYCDKKISDKSTSIIDRQDIEEDDIDNGDACANVVIYSDDIKKATIKVAFGCCVYREWQLSLACHGIACIYVLSRKGKDRYAPLFRHRGSRERVWYLQAHHC